MRRRTLALVVGSAAILLAAWLLFRGGRGGGDASRTAPDAGPSPNGELAHADDVPAGDFASDDGPRLEYGIEGRVEDDAGRSVPGARVRVAPDPNDGILNRDEATAKDLVAGPDGTFRADDLPEGTWLVFADHDRHPVGGFAGPFSIPRPDVHPVVVVLGSAAAIEGAVTDRTERPIASVALTIEGLAGVETDGRGEYRFGALDPRRTMLIKAQAEGYAPVAQTVRVRAGETSHVDFVLSAGREVSGRVVDESRRPVAGARVTVAGVPDAHADSDEYGEFQFANLPSDPLTMTAFHLEYTESSPVAVGPNDRTVELVLRRAASIAGTVLDPGGDVVMGVRVSLVPTGGPAEDERRSQNPRTALSNADGTFLFQQVVEGTYSLVARSQGEAGRVDGVRVRSGEEKTGVDLRLGGRFEISGRVITQFTGEPIAGAAVEARFPPNSMVRVGEGAHTLTDARGRFELEDVPIDLAGLRVSHAAHAAQTFPVRPSGDRMDVGDLALEPRQFGGVGMTLRADDGAIEVREVMEGLPAERAGLQPGDVILAVDGETAGEMSLEDVVGRIRGTEGETVKLLVRRQGHPEPFELSVVRETVEPESER